MQIFNQTITWQQLSAFRHVDWSRSCLHGQTEHQNGKESENGCWSREGWKTQVGTV